jgi:Restriction endonuclease BglII
MTNHALIPSAIAKIFEVHEWRNALAILSAARPQEWKDICEVLSDFKLTREDLVNPGGNKSELAKKLDQQLAVRGWVEKSFQTQILVDGVAIDSPTHSIDCYKGRVALEVEWNNKDPFFDRDLNNFRLLFDLRAIDVGVIITRSTELQALFRELGRGANAGASTTHMDKLLPKLHGGGGGGCPVVVFGIRRAAYVDNASA